MNSCARAIRRLLLTRIIAILFIAGPACADESAISRRFQPLNEKAPNGSAGLFIGVKDFPSFGRELKPLKYTVNDAVAMAYLFAFDLRLIPPQNCTLAISSDVVGNQTQRKFDALINGGARRVDASRDEILVQLQRLKDQANQEEGFAVIFASSHGFTKGRDYYVLASSSRSRVLDQTAVGVDKFEEALHELKAGKRLLICDACRQELDDDTKELTSGLNQQILQAFNEARGHATILSCDENELSYEDEESEHGAFTRYFLEAGAVSAVPESDGRVTLGAILRKAADATRTWSIANKSTTQSPWIGGPHFLQEVPLARDPELETAQKEAIAAIQELITKAQAKMDRKGAFNLARFDRLAEALEQARNDNAFDADLLANTRSFVAGGMTANAFAAYLDEMLEGTKLEREFRAALRLAESGDAKAMARVGNSYSRGWGVTKDWNRAAKWYEDSANNGDPEGIGGWGRCKLYRRGTPKDEPGGLALLRQASDLGEPWSMYWLGLAYRDGNGMAPDDQQSDRLLRGAFDVFQRRAESGDLEAMWQVANAYYSGTGVALDGKIAAVWSLSAAEKGFPPSMGQIGQSFDEGIGVPQDYPQALAWYKRAIKGGLSAHQRVGRMYWENLGVPQNYPEAVWWFKEGAKVEDGFSMYWLGKAYENGHGVERDGGAAVSWYHRAAKAGNAPAMGRLGRIYMYGECGETRDDVEAVHWLRQAADLDDHDAINDLGYMYDEGRGVPESPEEAAKLFLRIIDKGDANAMANYGSLLLEGRGVAKDEVEAREWLEKAAQQNSSWAMFKLGGVYEQGRGVPENMDEAIAWYRKGAALNDNFCRDRLKELGVE